MGDLVSETVGAAAALSPTSTINAEGTFVSFVQSWCPWCLGFSTAPTGPGVPTKTTKGFTKHTKSARQAITVWIPRKLSTGMVTPPPPLPQQNPQNEESSRSGTVGLQTRETLFLSPPHGGQPITVHGAGAMRIERGVCLPSGSSRSQGPGSVIPGAGHRSELSLFESRQKGGQGREGVQGLERNISSLHAGGETHGRGVKSTSLSEAAG